MASQTIQEIFEQALQHHQSGRLPQAEQLYRSILSQQPQHSGAMHGLGVIAHQSGRHDIAQDLIRRAIALNPDWPEAYNNLSLTLREMGRFDDAIAAARQAIALKPNYHVTYNNLGNALKDNGQIDLAIAAFRQAIAFNSDYADAYYNLANALHEKGEVNAAIAAFRQAISLNPNLSQAYNNLGNALIDKGQGEEAIAEFRNAISLKPDYVEALTNLGNALKVRGQLDEAIAAHRQAISFKPEYAAAHNNLGNALADKGEYDQAITSYHKAIVLQANHAEAYTNLGNALSDKGLPDDAVAAYRQAISFNPNHSQAHNNLGNALAEKGELDAAIASFRQAVKLKPNYARAHSNAVLMMLYHPASDAISIAQELRQWNEQHAKPLAKFIQALSNDRNPDRRLRIGYVSSDFRDHAVGRNLLPLFNHHDHNQFEIYCYAQVPRPDAATRQFQQKSDHWRSILGLNEEQIADQIRGDGIDILVDLNLHTANNRLLVFARKPAPVQVTFAGYPGCTGLTALDYRLSDPHLDPPGADDSQYSEKTIRLPNAFWCYDPLDCRDIAVNFLPAEKSGFITFGCLNNFCKVNDSVLSLWSQVLRESGTSRLLMLAREGTHRQRMLDYFSRQSIDPARIEFAPFQPRHKYLELYHRIDIGLDTFPYNGHTTSLDSLWMGVPVVTLIGQRPVSRAGWSQLSNLGLTELAAQTQEQFVQIAVKLAQDLPKLSNLRATLRRRMEQSPLMHAPKFAHGIEAAYRRMWQTWIAG